MDSLVGLRFLPTNEEIIHLLFKKRSDPGFSVPTIKEMDIYSCDPWELPRHLEIQSAEQVWYFFCEPYYKYAKSKRQKRRTTAGYWKITGTGSTIRAKNSDDVIGNKKILSFYHLDRASRERKSEWVMHEFHIEDNPLYKKDFVVCRIQRKQNNKHGSATRDKGQSRQQLVSDSKKNVTESNLLKFAFSPRQNLVYGAENIFSKSQLSPNDNLNSHSKSHEAKTASPELQLVSSPNSISYRNDDAKSDSLESQLLPYHHVNSSSKIDFAENTSARSQLPLGHTFLAESPQLPEFDELNDFSGLNGASFFEKESQISAQQGSTNSSSSSNSCFLNSNFCTEQVNDLFNSQRAFQNNYSCEETGQTPILDSSSSKSDGGGYMEDRKDMDAETIEEWINELRAA